MPRRSSSLRVFCEREVLYESHSIQRIASFGVACIRRDIQPEGNLLKLADQALYRDKESGRNRVVLAAEG